MIEIIKTFLFKKEKIANERLVSTIFFLTFFICLAYFQVESIWLHHLDTTFLLESLDSIKKIGISLSSVGSAFPEAAPTFPKHAYEVCKLALNVTRTPLNVLDMHAYFILYPLSILSFVVSSHYVIAIMNALSFAGLVYVAYLTSRKAFLPVLPSILFCILVISHPAWSHSFLGDIYADRFFLFFGMLYIYLLYWGIKDSSSIDSKKLLVLLSVGLFASAVNERAAIMIALISIFFLIFSYKEIINKRFKFFLFCFSSLLLTYVYWYFKQRYIYHPGNTNLVDMVQAVWPTLTIQYESKYYVLQAKEFITINIFLFGFLAIFNWRLGLLSLFSLLPNLYINMGGAEKSGWGTHYHSMYFPILVFSAAIGLGYLWNKFGNRYFKIFLLALLVILIFSISSYSKAYGSRPGGVLTVFSTLLQGKNSSITQLSEQYKVISESIPAGASVSTTEEFMPSLYRDKTIYFYPAGINQVDYVLLRETNISGNKFYDGAVNYIGETQQVNECLSKRLRETGYSIEKSFPGNAFLLRRPK